MRTDEVYASAGRLPARAARLAAIRAVLHAVIEGHADAAILNEQVVAGVWRLPICTPPVQFYTPLDRTNIKY